MPEGAVVEELGALIIYGHFTQNTWIKNHDEYLLGATLNITKSEVI